MMIGLIGGFEASYGKGDGVFVSFSQEPYLKLQPLSLAFTLLFSHHNT